MFIGIGEGEKVVVDDDDDDDDDGDDNDDTYLNSFCMPKTLVCLGFHHPIFQVHPPSSS